MDTTLARYADGLTEVRIDAKATELSTSSHLVAAIMRAATAAAAGEMSEAGRRVIDAICSIDGAPVPQDTLEAARQALAPLYAATAGRHTCQACVVRSLVELVGRLEHGVRAERIGEILGGLHCHAAELHRANRNRIRLPLAA